VSIIPIRGIVLAEESWDALGTALLENCSIASPRFDLQCVKWLDEATVEKGRAVLFPHDDLDGRPLLHSSGPKLQLNPTLFDSFFEHAFAPTLLSRASSLPV
jgi:hypothetical protein